jgi:hypothetical protein
MTTGTRYDHLPGDRWTTHVRPRRPGDTRPTPSHIWSMQRLVGAEQEHGLTELKVSNKIVASQFLPTVLQQNMAARMTLTLGPCLQMTTTAATVQATMQEQGLQTT